MIEIYSKHNNKLLHLVYSPSEFPEGATELVNPCHFIQCMFLNLPKGKKFPAHQHIWKDVMNKQTISQESWVVLKGSAKGSFFDTTGELLKDVILKEGDITFTLDGAHSLEILENNTLIYEFKTGPYEGAAKDKVFL